MNYELVLRPSARRELAALDREVQRRLDPHLLALSETPRPVGAIKLRGHDQRYRVRVGTYRIIYEVDDTQQRVTVLYIGHRDDAYTRQRRR